MTNLLIVVAIAVVAYKYRAEIVAKFASLKERFSKKQ
jgi:hypothetical protein